MSELSGDTGARARTARITRDDLEARFRAIAGDVSDNVGDVRQLGVPVAAAAGVLVVLLAFVLGRRRGRSNSTVVEIRRL